MDNNLQQTFWTWALKRYEDPGLRDCLLALQESCGLVVVEVVDSCMPASSCESPFFTEGSSFFSGSTESFSLSCLTCPSEGDAWAFEGLSLALSSGLKGEGWGRCRVASKVVPNEDDSPVFRDASWLPWICNLEGSIDLAMGWLWIVDMILSREREFFHDIHVTLWRPCQLLI